MNLIRSQKALTAFRSRWSGPRLLQKLEGAGGRLLIDWAVGVGKSYALDGVIEAAVDAGNHDLVVALLPTRAVLDERRWITSPPTGISIANLRPRPTSTCGSALDTQWRALEQNGLGLLGRKTLCGNCPRRSRCFWPRQYGQGLKGAQVVFATQAHLERDPGFLLRLRWWTGGKRLLLLLDEAGFVAKTQRRVITHRDLVNFLAVLKASAPSSEEWVYLVGLLQRARTEDLRSPGWGMPSLSTGQAFAIQEEGHKQFGHRFSFIVPELKLFGLSPHASRERLSDGDVAFTPRPWWPRDMIIFSGTANTTFTAHRLGIENLPAPFADCTFSHPGTKWFNIDSRLGMKTYWPKNSPQILDFFAGLTARRLEGGKRILLVAKKGFIAQCAVGMTERLKELGHGEVEVITDDWDNVDLNSPKVIPIINYGTIGVNLFEEFDCAYCLTGYYVNLRILNGVLQDLLAKDFEIPIAMGTTVEPPRRRWARAKRTKDRYYDVHQLAQPALDHLERDMVLQAVGRVRPYTKPREIITFQCADHPQLDYTAEFDSLEGARKYFNIPSRRAAQANQTRQRVQAAKAKGLSRRKAAKELGLHRSTIRRHWLGKH